MTRKPSAELADKLTKREHAAVRFLPIIIASHPELDPDEQCRIAVSYADRLYSHLHEAQGRSQ